MKPLTIIAIVSLLSFVAILPTYAQLYPEPPSSAPSNFQQNQVKITDKGGLMVGFYTDPENPTVSDQTSLEISFEDKDSQISLSNIDYQVLIAKNNIQVYKTTILHSSQGEAKVQYQFKDAGQYQIIVYVNGMNSQQIPQQSASFDLVVGSSAVPEFPTSAAIILSIALVSIVMVSSRKKLGVFSN